MKYYPHARFYTFLQWENNLIAKEMANYSEAKFRDHARTQFGTM